MSEYLDWEDLIDDEDQEPSSQEDRPALDDLLNREDIPDEWVCPECGVSKFDFELLEE